MDELRKLLLEASGRRPGRKGAAANLSSEEGYEDSDLQRNPAARGRLPQTDIKDLIDPKTLEAAKKRLKSKGRAETGENVHPGTGLPMPKPAAKKATKKVAKKATKKTAKKRKRVTKKSK